MIHVEQRSENDNGKVSSNHYASETRDNKTREISYEEAIQMIKEDEGMLGKRHRRYLHSRKRKW